MLLCIATQNTCCSVNTQSTLQIQVKQKDISTAIGEKAETEVQLSTSMNSHLNTIAL